MIESIQFTNFKALRKTTLPLAPFTLLLGPNGSGKSSVLQALQDIAGLAGRASGVNPGSPAFVPMRWQSMISVTAKDQGTAVEIKLRLRLKEQVFVDSFQWRLG